MKDAENLFLHGLAERAYIVKPSGGDPHDPFPSTLVYAQSEAYACEIGAGELDGGFSPEDCEAEHDPRHDARARTFFIGCVEHDPEYLRDAGWRYEGEDTCCCCGLAAFGMEQYAVCRVSNNCRACGCDDPTDPTEEPCDHEEGFSSE